MSEAVIIAILGIIGSIITAGIGAFTTVTVERIKAQKDKTSVPQTSHSFKVIVPVTLASAFIGLVLGVFFATSVLRPKSPTPATQPPLTSVQPSPQPTQTTNTQIPKAPTSSPPVTVSGNCESITADGDPVEFYSVSGREWSEAWRTWWWAQIAFQKAKEVGANEALIHQIMISQYVHSFYRFEVGKDAILYEAKVSKDSTIEIGSCWKQAHVEGHKIDVDKYGTRHETEKLTIYVFQK
jgi:hypothetical protein